MLLLDAETPLPIQDRHLWLADEYYRAGRMFTAGVQESIKFLRGSGSAQPEETAFRATAMMFRLFWDTRTAVAAALAQRLTLTECGVG